MQNTGLPSGFFAFIPALLCGSKQQKSFLLEEQCGGEKSVGLLSTWHAVEEKLFNFYREPLSHSAKTRDNFCFYD
jgi:hypothetical protein